MLLQLFFGLPATTISKNCNKHAFTNELSLKYGAKFVNDAMENKNLSVNADVVALLSPKAVTQEQVTSLISALERDFVQPEQPTSTTPITATPEPSSFDGFEVVNPSAPPLSPSSTPIVNPPTSTQQNTPATTPPHSHITTPPTSKTSSPLSNDAIQKDLEARLAALKFGAKNS
ncbi:hypothetical protein Pelo_17511 [Pelomyxa schiedti]|nr:hypothetical protein Pelo_17511 [Pelomyxa schiedti]